MAGRPTDSIHDDAKRDTSWPIEAKAPLVCGNQVDSKHATNPIMCMSRHHVLKVLSALLAGTAIVAFWFDALPACGLKPTITTNSAGRIPRAVTVPLSEDFQVYPPVLTVTPDGVLEITDGSSNASVAVIPSTKPTCQSILVQYSFASSYGQPYVGTYTPPSCQFNRVSWNLTVESAGRQFDRLGSVSFGDVELFRTSTAEPTKTGITWTYIKDMTSFLSLFKTKQTVIFDLGNIITDVYTAPFNVTLTAAFFTASDSIQPADEIIPVSKRQGSAGQPSYFTFPQDTAANNITLPQNVKKAVFTVAATGQALEEFWWGNVLQSQVDTFGSGDAELPGFSPFREVQLYIDGLLAGVAWPYPVIFTGGVVPGLWRPIVGIDAFDLKEDEIDITPWLGLLCNGKSHNFEMRVTGLNDSANGVTILSETTDSNWWLAGKIFVWLDTPGHVTTGGKMVRQVPAPVLEVSSHIYHAANGSNSSLSYTVDTHRQLSISSIIKTSNASISASWTQQLSYRNVGNYTSTGNQTTTFRTTGLDKSASGYVRTYDYPLYSFSTQALVAGNLTLTAALSRSKNVETLGQSVFPTGLESFSDTKGFYPQHHSYQGASLLTAQNGTAFYTSNQTERTSYSYGTTEQDMTFSGVRGAAEPAGYGPPQITETKELFHRHVLAVNGSIITDEETLLGTGIGHRHGAASDGEGMALSGMPGKKIHEGL